MITLDQIERLRGNKLTARVQAILVRNFKPSYLDYELLEGTIIELCTTRKNRKAILYVSGEIVDFGFPIDSAELLE